MAQKSKHISLRMPVALVEECEKAATENYRSLSKEILLRLERDKKTQNNQTNEQADRT